MVELGEEVMRAHSSKDRAGQAATLWVSGERATFGEASLDPLPHSFLWSCPFISHGPSKHPALLFVKNAGQIHRPKNVPSSLFSSVQFHNVK